MVLPVALTRPFTRFIMPYVVYPHGAPRFHRDKAMSDDKAIKRQLEFSDEKEKALFPFPEMLTCRVVDTQ